MPRQVALLSTGNISSINNISDILRFCRTTHNTLSGHASTFLPPDATLERYVMTSCLSVRPSVTNRSSIKTA